MVEKAKVARFKKNNKRERLHNVIEKNMYFAHISLLEESYGIFHWQWKNKGDRVNRKSVSIKYHLSSGK